MLGLRLLSVGLLVVVASTKDKLPPTEPASAETLYTRGLVQVGSGDYKEAEKTAKQGLRQFPEANGFHFILGECHYFQNRIGDAFYQYQWEIARVGNRDQKGQASAKRIAEIVTGNKTSDGDEARRVIQAVGEMLADPQATLTVVRDVQKSRGPEFALRLFEAEALYQAGDLKAAEPIYRELIHKDPTFVGGYVELSGLLDKQGKQKESEQYLARAKTIDPDNWQLQLPK